MRRLICRLSMSTGLLGLLTLPTVAAPLYDNYTSESGTQSGLAISGQLDNFNSFSLTGPSTVTGVEFTSLSENGLPLNVNWAITTNNGNANPAVSPVTVLESGVATLQQTQTGLISDMYPEYDETFAVTPLSLDAGNYYLELYNGSTTTDPAANQQLYWDVSGGASQEWELYAGTGDESDPSESFRILGSAGVEAPEVRATGSRLPLAVTLFTLAMLWDARKRSLL